MSDLLNPPTTPTNRRPLHSLSLLPSAPFRPRRPSSTMAGLPRRCHTSLPTASSPSLLPSFHGGHPSPSLTRGHGGSMAAAMAPLELPPPVSRGAAPPLRWSLRRRAVAAWAQCHRCSSLPLPSASLPPPPSVALRPPSLTGSGARNGARWHPTPAPSGGRATAGAGAAAAGEGARWGPCSSTPAAARRRRLRRGGATRGRGGNAPGAAAAAGGRTWRGVAAAAGAW
ncbi:hypothetical protein PVAP13_3KG317108 [Panicum virgatum]|uniref:Uncharacterized protein n=1 Tax=Panicum virgatum TaxID=38727 RepID=A0A8T0V267_PANVG|nr:hypothetical protein PVAP13_3KG317108 [Panicum virgatum]